LGRFYGNLKKFKNIRRK